MIAMGKRESMGERWWNSGHGSSVCVRCPKTYPTIHPNANRAVPVSFTFQGKSMCPEHTLEAIHEAGLTLDEAMGA